MTHTVLVTGATGYIAKHIVLQLLNEGHTVVGSVRSLSRGAEVRDAVAPHLTDPKGLDRLKIVALDLLRDEGWDAAMDGVDVVMHTASPVPVIQPKDENETIRPAVDGAMRAVQAARRAGVTRVIMTSSIAAVMGCKLAAGQTAYDETNWTDLSRSGLSPYVKSKTLAEKAVWDWQASDAPEMQITMINPAFVMGAPLDAHFASSVTIVTRLFSGKDPMLPRIGFTCVDVGDIARMHLRAMAVPASIGQRFIGAQHFFWYSEIARILQADHPDRRLAKPTAPNFLVRFLALFDPTARRILPTLGRRDPLSADSARKVLGIDFRDTTESIRETGRFLVSNNLV